MILIANKQKEYELLDSGDGYKLERYGSYIISRPDPEALWYKLLSKDIWEKAELKFTRNGEHTKWIIKENITKSWDISLNNLIFRIKPTSFKHIGLFPEQMINWQWMENLINKNKREKPISVLNLFAYTGGATLACARAEAEVCHVDGSKTAVAWARENAELSDLKDAHIRWIVDDVILFMKREIKRGRKYDAIIMDPPAFGHGPKDELWKIEENFLELVDLCKQLLSSDPLFILMNGYTAGYSPITYENNLKSITKEHNGIIKSGELVIKESESDRLLPCGIFARWEKK